MNIAYTDYRRFNDVVRVPFRGGWVGLFSGENQSRAVGRVLSDINGRSLRCAALIRDRWNIFAFLWWGLISIVSLGFYVRVPNVLIITEPISQVCFPPPPQAPGQGPAS